jgi:hypothetical protein
MMHGITAVLYSVWDMAAHEWTIISMLMNDEVSKLVNDTISMSCAKEAFNIGEGLSV